MTVSQKEERCAPREERKEMANWCPASADMVVSMGDEIALPVPSGAAGAALFQV